MSKEPTAVPSSSGAAGQSGQAPADESFNNSHVLDPAATQDSQETINAEMKQIHDAASGETQPRVNFPPYRSSLLRHPTKNFQHSDPEGIELWTPAFGHRDVDPLDRPRASPAR